MERNSYNGDFERFLRDNANGYRMYPSEKVWKGVHRSLHVRPKWYRLSALLLLFSFLTTGMVFIFSLKKNNNQTETTADLAAGSQNTRKSGLATQTDLTKASTQPESDNNPGNYIKSTSSGKNTNTRINPLPSSEFISYTAEPSSIPESMPAVLAAEITPAEPLIEETYNWLTDRFPNEPASAFRSQGKPLATSNLASENTIAVTNPKLPFVRPSPRKLNWQVHFTPTVSYRKLSENKQYRPAGSVNYTSLLDVNDAVNHKPDIGFEIGLDARYSLSNKLRARIGIQSNVTRYEIRAYSSRTELATITLNSQNGSPNSVSAISNYRNFGGYNSNWLENLYLQVSIPFGIDYIIADNKKTQFGISSSLQPTYLLGKQAYLLSADYKNYVKVPDLIRRWNANVDFETFVAYSTGKIKWQVGPQVRYQIFSSFVDSYPVRENLFDFGLKLGMSLNRR